MFKPNIESIFSQKYIKSLILEERRIPINENMFLQFEKYDQNPIISIYNIRKIKEKERLDKLEEQLKKEVKQFINYFALVSNSYP